MLLTKDEVNYAMHLSVFGVTEALREGGYTETGITDVKFLGVNPVGQFVYQITYPDPEDEGDAVGRAYLKYVRKAFSKVHYLTGDF